MSPLVGTSGGLIAGPRAGREQRKETIARGPQDEREDIMIRVSDTTHGIEASQEHDDKEKREERREERREKRKEKREERREKRVFVFVFFLGGSSYLTRSHERLRTASPPGIHKLSYCTAALRELGAATKAS